MCDFKLFAICYMLAIIYANMNYKLVIKYISILSNMCLKMYSCKHMDNLINSNKRMLKGTQIQEMYYKREKPQNLVKLSGLPHPAYERPGCEVSLR